MSSRSRLKLATMSEHDALHHADTTCVRIMAGLIRLLDMRALDPLGLHEETRRIHVEMESIMEKLKAAHKPYEYVHGIAAGELMGGIKH